MSLTYRISYKVAELYSIIHPYEIFKFYCPNWSQVNYEINKNFHADPDLRPNDKSPSARITVSGNNNLYYIDYGEGVPYTAADFVGKKFNLSLPDSLDKIYKEISKSHIRYTFTHKEINNIITNYKHTATVIKVKKRGWTSKDLNYWLKYGWTLELLDEAIIYPVIKYWINGKLFIPYEPVYAFDYYWHENIFRRKLYFPFNRDNRFISNIDITVVQGWHMLPKEGGDLLIITKGYKDIGTFISIGIHACATNNETSFFPEEVVDKIKSRWKRIIIWWDNDNEGMKSSKKYAEKFDLEYIYNNEGDPKDPSDYFKEKGRENFIKLVNEKLNL